MNTVAAGTHFNFKKYAKFPKTDVWRAIDHSVARWVLAHGGTPVLAEVAGWASYAEGQGDTALSLIKHEELRYGMRSLSMEELAGLGTQALLTVVDTLVQVEVHTPFVLNLGYFYLRRNYLHECAVAAQLEQRNGLLSIPQCPMQEEDLDRLFNQQRGATVQAQRHAVRQVLGRRLFVLTGGPGTGKTTTVLRMLLAMSREHQAVHAHWPIIRLCAPTGKAAQRLNAAMQQGGADMRATSLPKAWNDVLDHVLSAESSTLHRLLGKRISNATTRRIATDILVIDEASMVDLALLRELLDALPNDSIVVLVGDPNQLNSIGAGSVLLDMVGALQAAESESLVCLQHSFRADTALVSINEAVSIGDRNGFDRAWQAAGPQAVRCAIDDRHRLHANIVSWTKNVHAVLNAAGAFEAIPDQDFTAIRQALHAVKQQQLLCALREHEFGSRYVNERIEAGLRQMLEGYHSAQWYPGRVVMISRNDYSDDLFNGDIGICLKNTQGELQVWFESAIGNPHAAEDIGSAAVLRCFATGNLPAHSGAFAVTIHKSQGSEYERVAIILPAEKNNAVLSRQLLYTALTRAKKYLELWTSEDVLNYALEHTVTRNTGLFMRLDKM